MFLVIITFTIFGLNPSSLKRGVATSHQIVFVQVLITKQPMGKIAPDTLKFILSHHLKKKNKQTNKNKQTKTKQNKNKNKKTTKFRTYRLPRDRVSFQSREVRGGRCSPMILKFGNFERI